MGNKKLRVRIFNGTSLVHSITVIGRCGKRTGFILVTDNAKVISAQCYIELLWLYPPFLLQSLVPYAMLLLPVFRNCKVLLPCQRAQVLTNAPSLPLPMLPLPHTFPRWHKG